MMPEQRLRYPKQQQQQGCEEEHLQQLRDHAHNQEARDHAHNQEARDHAHNQEARDHAHNQEARDHAHNQEARDHAHNQEARDHAHNQEATLRRVRALRGQAEHTRLSNAKLVEEMEQMTGLFQRKQKELLEAVSRVDQLSRQLEALRSLPRPEPPPHHGPEPPPHHGPEPPPHHGPEPPHRGPEPPHRGPGPSAQLEHLYKELQTPAEGHPPQQCGASRGASVGPYIQAPSTASGPPGPSGQEQLVKPAYPDGTATLPMPDSSMKAPPRPLKPASGGEISEINGHAPPPIPARNSRSSEDLSRDAQASLGGQPKTPPPPVPSKPRPPPPPRPGRPAFSRPPYSAGTFPGKGRPLAAPRPRPPPPPLPARGHTLPLPPRQEAPPPGAPAPLLLLPRPQTVAASSIYSVYTQRAAPGKGRPPPGAHAPTRTQPRERGRPGGGPGPRGRGPPPPPPPPPETERSAPSPLRPLSPTKLLPSISQPPYRRRCPVAAGDAHLEALEAARRRLQRAPRPLKKKCGSVAEPEKGPAPAGPAHVQRLLYQRATLVAMETAETPAFWGGAEAGTPADDTAAPNPNPNPPPAESQEDLAQKPPPPPLPPRSPAPAPAPCRAPPPQCEEQGPPRPAAPPAQPDARPDECPPYPPPPYPSSRGRDLEEDAALSTQPPDVTGQVTLPPVTTGKRSNLRREGSEGRHRGRRVQFSPLALLLDASLEGEYDLVQRVIYEVEDPSRPNDEGITALHNAVCAGHAPVVRFLLQFGVNVNAADSDGWTPLHCAASCNNAQVCEFLVESGAAPFAATYSDAQTAADKCEETEDGYAQCSHFLHGVQEQMGVVNGGVVYALWDYEAEAEDELAFREGDRLTVLRRRPQEDPHQDPHQEDPQEEAGWWWARCAHREGYIPTNLLGLYLRIKPRQRSLA